jgi:hypothetical protein
MGRRLSRLAILVSNPATRTHPSLEKQRRSVIRIGRKEE